MAKIFKLGTRASRLALKQAEEVQQYLPLAEFEVIRIYTQGDKDKLTSISEVEGSDFFTREIDQALLREEIDVAVHSSKDVQEILPKGLKVILETKSISPYDALVSRDNLTLQELPAASRIGASSLRRKEQLKLARPDLYIVDIRGTIEERMGFLEVNKIDALLVAHAALLRLGLENKAAQILSPDVFFPHPKQGSLTLVAKEKKWRELRFLLSAQARETGN